MSDDEAEATPGVSYATLVSGGNIQLDSDVFFHGSRFKVAVWKRHILVLSGTCIYHYRSRDAASPKEIIPLQMLTCKISTEGQKFGRANVVRILSGSRVINVVFDTQQIKDQWVTAINNISTGRAGDAEKAARSATESVPPLSRPVSTLTIGPRSASLSNMEDTGKPPANRPISNNDGSSLNTSTASLSQLPTPPPFLNSPEKENDVFHTLSTTLVVGAATKEYCEPLPMSKTAPVDAVGALRAALSESSMQNHDTSRAPPNVKIVSLRSGLADVVANNIAEAGVNSIESKLIDDLCQELVDSLMDASIGSDASHDVYEAIVKYLGPKPMPKKDTLSVESSRKSKGTSVQRAGTLSAAPDGRSRLASVAVRKRGPVGRAARDAAVKARSATGARTGGETAGMLRSERMLYEQVENEYRSTSGQPVLNARRASWQLLRAQTVKEQWDSTGAQGNRIVEQMQRLHGMNNTSYVPTPRRRPVLRPMVEYAGFDTGDLKAGVHVWRLERGTPVFYEEHAITDGKRKAIRFSQNGCYLVLSIGSMPTCYFWLGANSPYDAKAACALHAVSLCAAANQAGHAVSCSQRQLQGEETKVFHDLFSSLEIFDDGSSNVPQLVSVQEARRTELAHRENAVPRAYLLDGCTPRATAVACSSLYAASRSQLLVDAGSVVYLYCGALVTLVDRARSALFARAYIRELPRTDVQFVDVSESILPHDQMRRTVRETWMASAEKARFLSILANEEDEDDVQTQMGGDLLPSPQFPHLHEVGVNDHPTTCVVAPNELSCQRLRDDTAVVLDTGSEVAIWIGRRAPRTHKNAALLLGERLFRSFPRPTWVRCTRVEDGREGLVFRSKFADWEDRVTTLTTKPRGASPPWAISGLIQAIKGSDVGSPLPTMVIAHELVEQWIYNGKFFEPRVQNEATFLDTDVLAIVCPSLAVQGQEVVDTSVSVMHHAQDCIVYLWIGPLAPRRAWLSFTKELQPRLVRSVYAEYGQKVHVDQVTATSEPDELLSLLGGTIVVLHHGETTGLREYHYAVHERRGGLSVMEVPELIASDFAPSASVSRDGDARCSMLSSLSAKKVMAALTAVHELGNRPRLVQRVEPSTNAPMLAESVSASSVCYLSVEYGRIAIAKPAWRERPTVWMVLEGRTLHIVSDQRASVELLGFAVAAGKACVAVCGGSSRLSIAVATHGDTISRQLIARYGGYPAIVPHDPRNAIHDTWTLIMQRLRRIELRAAFVARAGPFAQRVVPLAQDLSEQLRLAEGGQQELTIARSWLK